MKRIWNLFVFILCILILSSTSVYAGPTVSDESETDETSPPSDVIINIGDERSTPESTYGKDVKLDIPLINDGENHADDVKITPILDSSTDVFPYEIKQMNYEKEVGTLEGSSSSTARSNRFKTISYTFTTRKDAPSGYTKISFLISYRPEVGTARESVTRDLFVKTIGAPPPTQPTEAPIIPEPIPTPELPVSVPRVIVSGFTTEPAEVKAGDQFKLTLHITNTSSKTSVNNLEFNINSEADGVDPASTVAAFLPVAGSSSIFLNSIGKEETKDISIDMTAKADLAQKPYVINLDMKYEDGKVNQYTSEASVSIPVKQEARVDVNEPQVMPNSIMVGQESNVMFSIFNIGKTKIYNTSIKFESDSISGGEAFAGNIEPGAVGNIDTMLVGQAPTMDDGVVKILITYEDESGNPTTIEKEITLFINEQFIDEFPMEPGEEFPEEGNQSSFSPIVIVVLLIVIAVVVFIILRRRKLMEEGMEDEIS